MVATTPVALVSGATTVAAVATDHVDGVRFQVIKLNIGAASADNLFVGGQRDPENSISIVGASGALFSVAASVRGNVAASVAGTVDVSSRQIDVSAHGNITASVQGNVAASVAGHVLVSGDGIFSVNPTTPVAATADGGLVNLVGGVTPASVATYFLVDTAGRLAVSVSGGQIVVSNTVDVSSRQIDVSAHGMVIASVQGHALVSADGHVLVSADGTISVNLVNASGGAVAVSARNQADVSAHGIVSAAGHVLVSGDGIFTIAGNVASDAADAGNPVKIGGIVVVSANPASAAASDRVNATFDKVGRQVVVNQQPRELVVQAQATVESANRTVLGSGGTGIFQDLTHLSLTNAAATAVTVYVFPTSAGGAATLIFNLAAGGGVVNLFQPPWKQPTADRVWSLQSTSAATGFVYANLQAVLNT